MLTWTPKKTILNRMVEYTAATPNFDLIFQALSDGTRRDILRRVLEGEKTISELASKYKMSFAAVAKHLNVLQAAGLIRKRRQGRQQIAEAQAESIQQVTALLQEYEAIWTKRFDRLDELLAND